MNLVEPPVTMPDAPTAATAPPAAPIDIRSGSLVLIAALLGLYGLHWAGAIVIPMFLGLMLSHALSPLVRRLELLRMPASLAAAVVLVVIVGGIGSAGYALFDDAANLLEALPEAAQKLRRQVVSQRSESLSGTIEKVQRAAAEIELAAEQSASAGPLPARGVTKVQVEKGRFNVRDYLWPGALGVAAAAGQATVVLFVAYFLLAAGNSFRRKMFRIAGPSFGQKKLTLQALDQVNLQIQRYLLVQVLTSALVGVATALGFLALGVEHALVWGAVAFVLNFVPYFGALIVTGASALMGFVQFGSFEMALAVGGVSLFINSIEGYLLTPWLTSRASRMNPVAVFVGVLVWGWLWGIAGLFLGVPILLAIKAVCDRVDTLTPVGELLGD